jgi:hypothetical protein
MLLVMASVQKLLLRWLSNGTIYYWYQNCDGILFQGQDSRKVNLRHYINVICICMYAHHLKSQARYGNVTPVKLIIKNKRKEAGIVIFKI